MADDKENQIGDGNFEPLLDRYENKNPELSNKLTKAPKKRWFRWLKRGMAITSVIIAVVVVVGYNVATSGYVIEQYLLPYLNKNKLNGHVSFKVRQASLFRGFIFDDIKVLSGPDFDKKPLVKIKRLAILYNIYGFWAGDFGINEIGIYQPKITLIQKNNIFNFATLAKETEKKPEEPEEEPEKSKKESKVEQKSISTFFSMRVFFKFVLENLSFTLDATDESNKVKRYARIKDFTVRTHILTKKFSEIPLDTSALHLLDTFLIQLNPQKKIKVKYSDKDFKTNMAINLHWLLYYDGQQEKPAFNTKLLVGSKNIPLTFKGRNISPLNFLVDYDINYDADRDLVDISRFNVSVLNRTWLNLTGAITDAAQLNKKKKRVIDIRLDESDIQLGDLYPLYRKFTRDRSLRFRGGISLAPLTITGPESNLNINGNLSLKNIRAKTGGLNHKIPSFKLDYDALLNVASKSANPLAKLRHVQVKWRGFYNGSKLKSNIYFNPNNKTDIGISITNLKLSHFTKAVRKGKLTFKLSVKGPRINKLKTKVKVEIPSLIYVLNRGKSGLNQFSFNMVSKLSAPSVASVMKSENMTINVSKLNLTLKNKERQKTFWFNSNVKIKMKSAKDIKIKFTLKELAVNLLKLKPSLTEALKESFGFCDGAVGDICEEDIALTGTTKIALKNNRLKLKHRTNIKIKGPKINDIVLKTNIYGNLSPQNLKIDDIELTGMNDALSLRISGKLKEGYVKVKKKSKSGKIRIRRVKKSKPDLKIVLSFGKKQREKIFKNFHIVGKLGLRVAYKNDIADGNLFIKHFTFDDNFRTKVKDINMKFPFKYDLNLTRTLNLTAANKERIIKNYNFTEPFNFTMESLSIADPIDKTKDEPFMLIYPQGKYPGFGATMSFKDNVFELPNLQIFMLNGTITGHDILFNVGGAPISTKKMEFISNLQIKELDFKQLMSKAAADSIEDGAISVDMFIKGRNLYGVSYGIENIIGYISIYKIGNEFAKQGLKVVKPDSNGITDFIVDSSIQVQKIDLDLKEGLVYSNIYFTKGFVGSIVSPAGNRIKQTRIPITEFFYKLKKEREVYRSSSDKKKNKSDET